MGTIAQKLEYLNDTRLLLKDNINKINNVLTDNSTFRSYPQELFNGYLDVLNNGTDTLWNNLEKVSASGEEATLENVENAPIKMVLNGNTSQDTTSGKNLFDKDVERKNAFSTGSVGQVVGYGNSSASYSYVNCAKLEANKTYTLSWVTEGTKGATTNRNSKIVDDNNIVLEEFATWINNVSKITFTPSNDGYLVLTTDISSTNIQLELGSTATSWEKYTGGQPSPSPDYPQEVKVVKGENVVSVQGKNLFDNVVFKDSNIINANGEETYNSLGCIWEKIKVKPNTTYTLSYTSTDYSFSQRISEYDSNNTFIQRNLTNSTPYTFTTNANTEYINLSGLKTDTNIMIEQNSQATPYVPYSKTDYPISLGTIELCKINTYKDYFHKDSGKWYAHKEVGKYIFSSDDNIRVSGSNYYTNISPKPLHAQAYMNTYLYDNRTSGFNNMDNYYFGFENTGIFHIKNTDVANKNEMKQSLIDTNSYLVYVLATPTEEEITNTTLISQLEAISKAKSVKDKTYITQTNEELPFILDVEAIKEYEVN